MELKVKYQYTYFIKPFLIKENKYKKYLLSLLNNKNYKLKIFEKERDFNIYSYFTDNVKNYFFPSFSFDKEKINNINKNSKYINLSELPCNIFEYKFKKRIQGKVNDYEGIFFNIDKIEIICFETGICFLNIKTDIENSNKFSDVLNFNYKFKSINSSLAKLQDFNNIKIQTDKFSNMTELSDFINNIIGVNNKCSELRKLDLFDNDFFVYTYSCINQENWNSEEDFNNLQNFFLKYSKVLTHNTEIDINKNEMAKIINDIENYKYSKFGFTKYSATLMTSDVDINNYTKLLFEYENEYLFTLIICLYQRIYLKKLQNDFNNKLKIKTIKRKFLNFTKKVWLNDITNSVVGTIFYNKWIDIFELKKIYQEIKDKYDITYKELNIENTGKVNRIILIALATSLLLNIINLIVFFKIK